MNSDDAEECLICLDLLKNNPPESENDFNVGPPGNELSIHAVGNESLQCLGEQHHKYHVKCFNSFVYSQVREPNKYALCMMCKQGMDANDKIKAKLLNDIVIIGDMKKNEKLKNASAIKNAKKDKDVLTETWLKLKAKKEYRGKLEWSEVETELVDVFYDKYYYNFVHILRKWLELHRDYDPSKKAPRERETALAELRGVDEALTDVGNELNLVIYYINDLTWEPSINRYKNDDKDGYGYHQYALPEDYMKELEATGLVSGEITDDTLDIIINSFLVEKRDSELLKNAGAGYTGNVGHLPPSDLNYVYTEVGVFDHKYNARKSHDTTSKGYGGSKPKKGYSRSKKMTTKRRKKNGLGNTKKGRKTRY